MISRQDILDFAGFRREEFEERNVLLLQAVGALAAGKLRRVEGQMTKQVKWVGVPARSLELWDDKFSACVRLSSHDFPTG